MTYKSEKPLRIKKWLIEAFTSEDHAASLTNDNILSRKERTVRSIFIALGVVVLVYIYTESLWAQQAAQQRISISQATDFPSDI